MRLSEALVLRADIQKRIQRLSQRLALSVLVQEGEQPPENPEALLAELDRLLEQLRDLIARVNRTNATTTLASGETITEALARRDVLRLRYKTLHTLADVASRTTERYRPTEIRVTPTIDVAALRQQTDALAQETRELDMEIQATNWTTELAE